MAIARQGAGDQRRDGWFNYCRQCNQRYWVRSADINKPTMPRWTDDECTAKHECRKETVKA